MRLLNRFDVYIYRCPMRILNRFNVYIYMFYELINVVFVERLRDLTSGIWLSLVKVSRVL